MNTKSTEETTQTPDYPLVLVGLKSSELGPVALTKERDDRFKCILLDHVIEIVGTHEEMKDVAANIGAVSGQMATLDAVRYLEARLAEKGTARRVELLIRPHGCRATPTGWVREWPFHILISDVDDGEKKPWHCGKAIDAYYQRYQGAPNAPMTIREDFEGLMISLVVVDRFEVICGGGNLYATI
ncbi:MAG: hypothetical protein AAF229_01910 [Pseudomonadota bacterium]